MKILNFSQPIRYFNPLNSIELKQNMFKRIIYKYVDMDSIYAISNIINNNVILVYSIEVMNIVHYTSPIDIFNKLLLELDSVIYKHYGLI